MRVKGNESLTIVLVSDVFDQLNNGTMVTAFRFAQTLRKRGHRVIVVSTGKEGEDRYIVPEKHWPVATWFAHRQGFLFANPDKDVFRTAFSQADIVHFLLPLTFDRRAALVAMEMGVPCSAAFHLQPENVTYNIKLGHSKAANRMIYRYFHHSFYRYFDHIHCPSNFIAGQLRENGYKAKLHVISNGVDADFVPPAEKHPADGLFHILMVGRLSPEKRQTVLIEAIQRSRYADKVQLHLAGNGPCKKALMQEGQKLKNPPQFGFYSKEDLIRLIHACDLYVHASNVEIEAISCMEAFACGLVPVIATSELSATVQFALDDRSLFRHDDPADLARKIDYWIEHPEEREEMSAKYAEQGNQYRVERSVEQAELMFQEVIQDHERKKLEGSQKRR